MARLSYLSVRNLVYMGLYEKLKPPKWRNDLTLKEKMTISGIAGVIGAAVSNTFEC